MYLEKIGRLFFSQIRPLFFFILVISPLFAATLYLYFEHENLQHLQERFAKAARKEKLAFERKERKDRFLHRYSHADPYFLDQQIESFPLLQKEKQHLMSLLDHPAFPNHQAIRDRLAFLEKNRLSFLEENIHTSAEMKEVDEKLRYPIQMDENDLKKLLSLLEDISIESYPLPQNAPQILIKDFRLKKIETSLQTEVFEVEMDLLKREFFES